MKTSQSQVYCLPQSLQSRFNRAVTLYRKQLVCVWADTVTLCSLSDTSNATVVDLQQRTPAHLIAPNVFSMYAALRAPQ